MSNRKRKSEAIKALRRQHPIPPQAVKQVREIFGRLSFYRIDRVAEDPGYGLAFAHGEGLEDDGTVLIESFRRILQGDQFRRTF